MFGSVRGTQEHCLVPFWHLSLRYRLWPTELHTDAEDKLSLKLVTGEDNILGISPKNLISPSASISGKGMEGPSTNAELLSLPLGQSNLFISV